jgi:hypothetical protein
MKAYKFQTTEKGPNGLHVCTRIEEYEKEINVRNCSKYGTMNIYFQNQEVYTCTEQKNNPFLAF